VSGAPSYDSASSEDYPPQILLHIVPKDGTAQGPLKCQLEIDGTTQYRCAFLLSLYPSNTTTMLTETTPQGMR